MLALAATLALAPLIVRRADLDLVPNERLPLGGYTDRKGKPSEPGGDVLKARTLVFEGQGLRLAVTSVEMLTVPDSLAREVRSRIPKDVRLFLVATHTHCAPDSQMLNDRMTFSVPGIASFKRRWLDWYADRIGDGIVAALRAKPRRESSIRVARFDAPLNRGRRPGALPDRQATLLLGEDGLPLWFHYAAHPVFYGQTEMHPRSDWPGVLERRGFLVLPGAIGDVSPAAPGTEPKTAPEVKIARFEDALLGAMSAKFGDHPTLQAPPRGTAFEVAPIRWVEQRIALDAKAAHPTFAQRYGVPAPLVPGLVAKFAPSEATIHAFRIGSLAVVGVPGEPTAELGRRIRTAGEELGFKAVEVVSHVDGWIGYILAPEDYDRGGYEATLSFHGRRTGDRVVDAAVAALKALKGAS